jgi:glucose/arabinose dehydrogenase
MLRLSHAAVAALFACAATPAFAQEPDGLKLPPGFHAQVVAEGLGTNVRHMAMRDNNTIYVSTRGSGAPAGRGGRSANSEAGGEGGRGAGRGAGPSPGIMVLHLDANHKVTRTDRFSEITGGTGIRIQGNYLYAATVTDVYRIALKPGETVPSAAPELLISGMPGTTFNNRMVVPDGRGNLFVSVGGSGNICTAPVGRGSIAKPKGLHPCPGVTDRGGVWKFSAGKLNQKFPADGVQIATGLRDTVAVDYRPGDALYLYMHDRSMTSATWPELVSAQDEENIGEEFHRLPVTVKEPTNMGWPYTYYDQVRRQRLMAPEYGGNGRLTPPDGLYATPVVTIRPSHSAPLDLVFYYGNQFPASYRGGAFVVRHGGNGPDRPEGRAGFDVMFIPFTGGGKPGTPMTFIDGFAGPTPASKIVAKATYRPGGAVVAPDGSLYVSETNKGRIWRITYDGK